MALNVYFARTKEGELYAATTRHETGEEARDWLDDSGGDEKFVGFVSLKGDTADALEALCQLDEFSEEFDTILTELTKCAIGANAIP